MCLSATACYNLWEPGMHGVLLYTRINTNTQGEIGLILMPWRRWTEYM